MTADIIRRLVDPLASQTARNHAREDAATEIQKLRDALRGFLAMFNDEGEFCEQHQDQASVAIERAESLLPR